MAALMLVGVASTLLYTLAWDVKAETTTVINTSSLKNGGDVLISVGLMFGSNITTSFQTTSTNGYTVGLQYLDGDRDFYEIWDIYDTSIAAMADANIAKSGMTYSITGDYYSTLLGGYHIQVDCDDINRWQFVDLMSDTEWQVSNLGLYQIPAYIYTGYAIRIGDFATWNDASAYLDLVKQIYPDRYVSIVSPATTAVSLVNPYSDKILFEFDCGGSGELGLTAKEDSNGNTYIGTPAGNVYDGVFCFKRYNNGSVDGVSLINILPLEAYLAGVLPFEVDNNWPIEVLKEFAVTVRSFTLTHFNKHSQYNFDLCNTTYCQIYKGAGRVNSKVMEAILDTEGQVITYADKIITAYYSSTMGGVTVSAKDAWGGGEVPYLQAKETPWEDYAGHTNGFWISEISPEALLERLHKAGYTSLKGAIEDVAIVEFASNSTYVKGLQVTDIYGNSITIRNTDKVRTSLSPYTNSANFVVGRGSVEYTLETPYDILANPGNDNVNDDYNEPEEDERYDEEEDDYEEDIDVLDKSYGYIDLDTYYVISSNSMEKAYRDDSVSILTGDGEVEHEKRDVFVMSRQSSAAFLGDEYLEYVTIENKKDEEKFDTEIVEDKSSAEVTYKIAYAEDPDNFIFVGKGWGHGVGISQYGAYDLANMGYTFRQILETYFKGIELTGYRSTEAYR